MSQSIPSRATVIIRALENGVNSVVARVIWAGGAVSLDGDPNFVADLSDGIEHPLLRTRILPSDGYRFLIAVLDQYRSPYLLATFEEADIIEET